MFNHTTSLIGMSAHGRISLPSQAKHLPLCFEVKVVKISSSFWTEYLGVKSFPSGTFPWKGLDKLLSTVPGCSPTIIAFLLRLLISIAAFLITIFRAALEARYAYQPPSWLSEMLPTRADNVANTDRFSLFNLGRKCFAT